MHLIRKIKNGRKINSILCNPFPSLVSLIQIIFTLNTQSIDFHRKTNDGEQCNMYIQNTISAKYLRK